MQFMAGKAQPDKSRTRQTLDDLADRRGFTSADIAKLSGIHPAQVHHDRTGHRKISAERLAAYCRAFGPIDQLQLVRAWIADVLDPDLFRSVEIRLAGEPYRVRETDDGASIVTRGRRGASPDLRDALDRLADACAADKELARAVKKIISRLVS
jgi:DNA-binding transcriptional regulator YdaS (Cro superfamily)